MTEKLHILLCCCGSVAVVKLPLLYEELKIQLDCEIKVILTESALKILPPEELFFEFFTDKSQWEAWSKIEDPILHIELARWADIICVVPLDANTLGKMACGIADNLVTTTIRAFPIERKLFCCPAMNTTMWEHPITQKNIETLLSWNYIFIPPIIKNLACGEHGIGAMEEFHQIVKKIKLHLEEE